MASKDHKNLTKEMESIGRDLVADIKSDISRKKAVETGKMKELNIM